MKEEIVLYEFTVTLLSDGEWVDQDADEMIRIVKPIQVQFGRRIEQVLRLLGFDEFRIVVGRQAR